MGTEKRLHSCKSKLPKTLEEIKELPGVGDYTGNALLAFIYNVPTIAIDGNVKRVLSRIRLS